MLIPLLAVGGLAAGRRRPLALVKRRVDARDDRRPGSVPQCMVAEETRARGGRRTVTQWLDTLRSCSPRHAMNADGMPMATACGAPGPASSPGSHACCPGTAWAGLANPLRASVARPPCRGGARPEPGGHARALDSAVART